MGKRWLIWGGLVALIVVGAVLFNHFHYSLPDLEEKEIRSLAEQQLKNEVPGLLRQQSFRNPYSKKEFRSLKVMEVQKLQDKMYLVFRVDYDNKMPGNPYYSGNYMLGLRLVEKHWGGIALKGGMEFESSYYNDVPVECGYFPQGVFYGFCRDPRVKKAVLELEDGQTVPLPIKNRCVLAAVPPKTKGLTPLFYDEAGNEIGFYNSGGIKLALACQDEKKLTPYTNIPVNWFPIKAEEMGILSQDMVDAIWVFPDQHQKVLQGGRLVKLKELARDGIPIIFIGMKSLDQVTGPFGFESHELNGVEKASDIEAVFVCADSIKKLKAGAITLDDDSQASPILEKSIELRYQLDLPKKSPSPSKGKVKQNDNDEAVTVTEPVPVPSIKNEAVTVTKPVTRAIN